MARTPKTEEAPARMQRRVYVLPTELVDRVAEYQRHVGLASEVEAVRRLLDEALKSRDQLRDIADRFISKFKETRSLREAARDVLTGHPLVKNIEFNDEGVKVSLSTGEDAQFDSIAKATLWDKDRNLWNFELDFDGWPEWASHRHARPKSGKKAKSLSETIDDDIPF